VCVSVLELVVIVVPSGLFIDTLSFIFSIFPPFSLGALILACTSDALGKSSSFTLGFVFASIHTFMMCQQPGRATVGYSQCQYFQVVQLEGSVGGLLVVPGSIWRAHVFIFQ